MIYNCLRLVQFWGGTCTCMYSRLQFYKYFYLKKKLIVEYFSFIKTGLFFWKIRISVKLANKFKKPSSHIKKYLEANKQINEKEVDLNRVTEALLSFEEQMWEKHGLTEYTVTVWNWLMYTTGLFLHLSCHVSKHKFQPFSVICW